MSDNPFVGIDKKLFSPLPVAKEKSNEAEPARQKADTARPQPVVTATTATRSAISQDSNSAILQRRKTATSQSRKIAKVQSRKDADSQPRKAAKSQQRKTAKLQSDERKSINHGLSIFEDQLISLKEIQLARQKHQGKKYSLGDLSKEALDLFIAKEYHKS